MVQGRRVTPLLYYLNVLQEYMVWVMKKEIRNWLSGMYK